MPAVAIVFLGLLLSNLSPAFAQVPDVSLQGLDGRAHHLSEYIGRGKWVIVNIWGPRCPPCRGEMPILNDFHEQHRQTDAIVLGMALDFPSFGYAREDEVRAFVDDYFISFPILLGDQEIASLIGGKTLSAVPTTYFFHPDGKLTARWKGTVTENELEEYITNYQPSRDDWFNNP